MAKILTQSHPHSSILALLLAISFPLSAVFCEEVLENYSLQKKEPSIDAKWQVRTEILIVAIPEAEALNLLPLLHSPDQIEQAVSMILDAVAKKTATLIGYPVAQSVEGVSAMTDTAYGMRYPTDFDESRGFNNHTPLTSKKEPKLPTGNPFPNARTTRDIGVKINVDTQVLAHDLKDIGIRASVEVQRIEPLGFERHDAVKTASGDIVRLDQPKTFSLRHNSTVLVRNGARRLLCFHQVSHPARHLEIYLIQAFATPTR